MRVAFRFLQALSFCLLGAFACIGAQSLPGSQPNPQQSATIDRAIAILEEAIPRMPEANAAQRTRKQNAKDNLAALKKAREGGRVRPEPLGRRGARTPAEEESDEKDGQMYGPHRRRYRSTAGVGVGQEGILIDPGEVADPPSGPDRATDILVASILIHEGGRLTADYDLIEPPVSTTEKQAKRKALNDTMLQYLIQLSILEVYIQDPATDEVVKAKLKARRDAQLLVLAAIKIERDALPQ